MRSRRAALCVVVLAGLLAGPRVARADAFDAIADAFKRLDKVTGKLFDGLQVTGRGDFSLRQDFTSGSRDAYQASYWNTDPLQVVTSLDIAGPVWGNFGLRAHVANSGYGYNDNRLMLGYQDRNTALLWGDLNVNLTGNQFAGYAKSLQGWQFDQRIGEKALLRGFTSQEKGLVRRQTFPGNNTSGPYFLTYTPVVDGSELIKVDERPVRFGEDYTLDYDTGQLYFEPPGKPPRIIPSTSIVAVSYQSATQYESGGSTQGAQLEASLLDDRLNLVATMLQHSTGVGAQSTARFQEDLFQGSGSTGPFDVRYSPILADGARAVINGTEQIVRDALIVTVDNATQREGVDYDAIRQIGRIIFRRVVPPTSMVRIRYYYQVGAEGADLGGSTVYGLALQHRVAENLSWNLSAAQSQAEGTGLGGMALSAGARYSTGQALDATVQYRSVDPQFRYVDTVGFLRNEKGLNAQVSWRPSQHIQLGHRFSDVKTNSGYGFGYSGYYGGVGFGSGYGSGTYPYDTASQTDGDTTPSTALDVRAQQYDTSLGLTYPGWPSLSASHQVMRNSGGSRGDSSLGSLSVNLDYSPQKPPMAFHASLTNSDQSYAGLSDGSTTTDPYSVAQSSSTSSMTLAFSWTPSDQLAFATNLSSTDASSGYKSQRSSSRNFQVSTRWSPSQNLNLNLDFTQTNSLGAVTSGFYGGGIGYGGWTPGYGYPGNPGGTGYGSLALRPLQGPIGGGGGSTDPTEPEMSRYLDSSTRLNLSWQPLSTLSLDANLGLRKYTSGGSVGYLADSSQRYGNLSASWLPNESVAFNLSLGSDLLQFLDAGRGGVLNNSLTFTGSYRPPSSRLTYGLSVNRQWGVSPNYTGFGSNEVAALVDTSLFDVSANVDYKLAQRARLVGRFGMSDFAGGFADFLKHTAEVGVEYQLSDSVGLNFGWQFIRNDSRLAQSSDTGGTGSIGSMSQDYTTNLVVFALTTNFQSTVAGSALGGPRMNEAITPGYGTMGDYDGGRGGFGTGFGGGFSGGLSLPRRQTSFGDSFGGLGGLSGSGGLGFGDSYGTYESFGRGSFGTGTGRLTYGGSSSGYGSSWGGSGYGQSGYGQSGYGQSYGSYDSYGSGSMSGLGAGRGGGAGGFGGPSGGGYGGRSGSPWGLPGGAPPGPGGEPSPRERLSQPDVGDPWTIGGGSPDFPVDDMRDV